MSSLVFINQFSLNSRINLEFICCHLDLIGFEEFDLNNLRILFFLQHINVIEIVQDFLIIF